MQFPFEGVEAISTPFSATLLVLADPDPSWLGQPGVVTLTDLSGHERTLAGIVTDLRDRGLNARHQSRVEVQLRPRLWSLSLSRDNRVFQGLSIPDLITQVLQQHDIAADSMEWRLSKTYAPLPYTVQYQETDLAFVERLLTGIGVSYWFTEQEGRDIVHFTDDNAKFTRLQLDTIPFISDAGLDKPQACFSKFVQGRRKAPAKVLVADYNYLTPDNAIKAGDAAAGEDPVQVHYGHGTLNQDEAELRSRLINERHAVEALRIEISGSAAGLLAGGTFGFSHPGHAQYSGDYLVTGIRHSLSQQALVEHEADRGNLAYTQTAQLIPATLPFRPAMLPPLRLPAVYSAYIESNGTYALLDEHGQFKVRSLFDTRDSGDANHTEASLAVRRLSFHGSPGADDTVGAALPLRDGVEVLWASVDGDPNRPVILGALPDPGTASPVSSNNFGDNVMRTGSRNELLLHDIKDQEHIELKQGDFDRPFNLLRLDANSAGHLVKFATTLGAMQIYAKQTTRIEAGDSFIQTHGNDRTETIENTHSLTTKNKDIHYQAATDQTHDAKNNVTHKADKNIEHKSGATTQWQVSRNSIITVKQGDQIIKIDNGSLKIQAGNGIRIQGQGGGSIKIGQSGAGLQIDAGGNVKLYGKAVTINGGSGVKLKGNVSYGTAAGSLSMQGLPPLSLFNKPSLPPVHVRYGFLAYGGWGARMSVTLQQLQAFVQTESELPDTAWFVTIDTSQVKSQLNINWEDLSKKLHWRNLLHGTAEGQEPDLTCWLAPLSEETLQLTAELIRKQPFCCTWLQSIWTIDEIASYWQHAANPLLPDLNKGLLRFYDTCVMAALQTALTPQQWQKLTAPLIQWLHINRNGNLATIAAPVQEVSRNGQFTLSKGQLNQLQKAGQTDNIIFLLQKDELLPEAHDPFSTYRQINTALALLNKHNITKRQEQYLFSALTLDWPLAHFANPKLDEALSRMKPGEIDLGTLVAQHAPQTDAATA